MIINLPKFEETMETGYITEYHIQTGDVVKKGDLLFEVETDKFTNGVESPVDGKIKKLLVEEGEELNVGDPVLELLMEEEATSVHHSSSEYEDNTEIEKVNNDFVSNSLNEIEGIEVTNQVIIPAVPAARALSNKQNTPLNEITGTGPQGAITLHDVEEHLSCIQQNNNAVYETTNNINKHQEVQAMVEIEFDMTEILKMRNFLSESLATDNGNNLPLTAFYVKTASLLLYKNRILNFQEDQTNIGVCVIDSSFHKIINQAHLKSVFDISKELDTSKENVDWESNFTISSVGDYRVKSYYPVLKDAAATCLGLGNIGKRLMVMEDDSIDVRAILSATLVFNPRVLNEKDALSFLEEFKRLIEQPSKLISWN